MKIIDQKLYLTFQEMIECGISENTLKDAKKRGTKCWDFMDDPEDKRRVLIGYEGLTDERKRLVELRYGNPYERVARLPILQRVINDWKAEDYYRSHKYELNGRPVGLPPEVVTKYTRAASWLNMLAVVQEDRAIIRKELKLTVPEFYSHAGALLNLEKERGRIKGYAGTDILPADFPTVYQRLMEKVKRYQSERYAMLIDPLFGNKIGSKLGKVDPNNANKEGVFAPERYEDQMAVIRYCSEQGNNLDAGQVAKMANIVFRQKGWKTISRATVNKIISENKHLFTAGRRGKKAHNTEVAMQVRRKVTQHPLMYWTLDGWTVELSYQEGSEYKRLVVVVVLDAFKKYPVGYAIGERENAELIREANRNALIHVKELFGQPYRPWQVQSDNYAISTLTPFYQAMAHLHTPAAVGNAKAKIIEPYFKDLNKNYCQLMPNWTGFNITAQQKNQVNVEKLNKVKHTFPDKAGVIRQIEAIIATERQAKAAEYTAGLMQGQQYELLQDKDWLRVFGRQLGERTVMLRGYGLEKTINGQKYVWDSFDPQFRENMHVDWTVYGDEHDMSRILVESPDRKLVFVLQEKRMIPMDVRSQDEADHAYRAAVGAYNKQLQEEITEQYGADADRARELALNTPWQPDGTAELAMKAMFITNGQQKERLQNAKKLGNKQQKEQKKTAIAEQNDWERRQQERYAQILNDNTICEE